METIESKLKNVEANFKNSTEEAEKLLNDKEKTKEKINDAYKKASENKGKLEEVWDFLQLFFSITKDYINGSYKEIPTGSIVLILASILYFLSPIDLIPDFIPIIGYIDDVFVLGLVFTQVKSDLEKYEKWKNS